MAEGILAVAAIAVSSFGLWRLSLRLWPYAPCRRCQGRNGRNPGSNRDRWGYCKRCGGSGRRLRWGARKDR